MRKIKQFFFDIPARPIVKSKKKDSYLNLSDFYSFGKLNKNKIFYVIKRSPGAGMFSNLTFVMNHLLIAQRHNFIPVVDMENYPTIYNEKKKINGTKNAWEYYFEPVSKYSLNEVYKSQNVFITSDKFSSAFDHKIYNKKKFNKIYKFIKIKKKLKNEIFLIKKKLFKNKKIIGIHYRGTSYKTSANHPFPPTKLQMYNLIENSLRNKNLDKIFLSTEDEIMDTYLKTKFKGKILSVHSFRSKVDNAFKIYPRNRHRYKLGKEIIVESYLLSFCKNFIFVQTNVSNFVRLINPKVKKKVLFNGLNSKNEYLAKFLWNIKKNLHPSLGGFKNKI